MPNIKHFNKKQYLIKWKKNNPNKLKHYQNRNRYHNKLKLFERLGGIKCNRCGFTDIRALQFDHINGGGKKQMGELRSTSQALRNYLKDENIKNKLQVLCANCNWIKRHENKE